MKLIEKNSIANISASTENINYPALNMLNNSPKKRWISASVSPQTIIVDVATGSEAIAFFNILEISEISATSIDNPSIEWGGSTAWGSPTSWGEIPNQGVTFTISVTEKNQAWIDFGRSVYAFKLSITITGNGGFPSIGIISSGPKFQAKDPQPGLGYSFRDYSIITELSNGAFDSRDRDTVREFSGTVIMTMDQFFDLSKKYRNNIKANPRAWWFVSETNEEEFIIYGRLASPISCTLSNARQYQASVNIEIIEEI